MKCPKCGKDVILQKKQVGVDENGNPVLNEYAICKDCKKQWNLDKQRAKKSAPKPAASVAEHTEATPKQETPKAPVEKTEEKKATEQKKIVEHTDEPKQPVQKKKRPASERPVSEHSERPKKKRPVSEHSEKAPRKKRPAPEASDAVPKKKRPAPADSKTRVISVPEEFKQEPSEEEQRYGNIPSEKVRAKRERAVKKSYEDMLASDPDRKSVHKRKPAPKPVEEPEEIEDEEEYEDDYITPRFRVLRVIFGLLSIVAFGFFTYKGVISGLDSITSGSNSNIGTFYVIMALCMLISGLLLLILQKSNTIFAFLLPMLFYIGCSVIGFLKHGDDKMLLYSAIACVVLAVIFLILTILSRRDTEEDEDFDDYDDPFEEDHDNY